MTPTTSMTDNGQQRRKIWKDLAVAVMADGIKMTIMTMTIGASLIRVTMMLTITDDNIGWRVWRGQRQWRCGIRQWRRW